ncbi:MAG TPA: response regulator transcription factor [Polyangiaceae bacterium]
MSVQILLIEDDPALGTQIVEHFERAGFATEWWQRGEMIDAELASRIRLVVLDLMLPGHYGLDVLKDLRTHSEVPVLVLSARNDKEDKVRALKLGADDYLTKPFWPEELMARVTARLRRPRIEAIDRMTAGQLEMRHGENVVFVSGQAIALTPVESGLMSALLRRPGSAVTRRWLVENLLERDSQGAERTLDVHMSRLRKKLGREGLIETVWGIGYRLNAGEPS